jgi:hypothetical protein
MKKKSTYRIRNWSKYNASLKKRGSLTIWVSPEDVKNWTTDELTAEPGASPTYTDLAIETIYGLAGRQTQGFLESVFELLKLEAARAGSFDAITAQAAIDDHLAGQGLVQVASSGRGFDRRQSLRRGGVESPPARLRLSPDLAQTPPLGWMKRRSSQKGAFGSG